MATTNELCNRWNINDATVQTIFKLDRTNWGLWLNHCHYIRNPWYLEILNGNIIKIVLMVYRNRVESQPDGTTSLPRVSLNATTNYQDSKQTAELLRVFPVLFVVSTALFIYIVFRKVSRNGTCITPNWNMSFDVFVLRLIDELTECCVVFLKQLWIHNDTIMVVCTISVTASFTTTFSLQ